MSIKSSKLFMTYVHNTDDNHDCSICRDNINDTSIYSQFGYDNDTTKTRCGHLFHTACLSNWTRSNRKCPFCAQKI